MGGFLKKLHHVRWPVQEVTGDERPGRCYEISVGGTGPEGNYSLSVKCTAALPVVCGTNVIGSTVGLPPDPRFSYPSGAQIHSFCPNTTESAEVKTCRSNFNTWLAINGDGVDRFFDAGSGAECGDGDQEIAVFDFEAGECYGIIVGGVFEEEGNYSLSIDCGTRSDPIEVQCGSTVSGSTNGLFQRIQPHLFCSDQTARVEASTCGSNFPTAFLPSNATSRDVLRDVDCADCSGDPNAACIGFNLRPDEPDLDAADYVCYEILVGGRELAEGNYSLSGECYEILVGEAGNQGNYTLSITCDVLTNATIKPLSCGSGSISGSTRNLPILRDLDRRAGGQLHQFCPTRNGAAEIDTCNSKYDTKLYVYGPGVALNCDNSCGGRFTQCGLRERVTFDFQAGECYDIIVGGFRSRDEGDYVLSIDCFNFTEVECGSNVLGSTVGLNGGVQRHRFCSNEKTRVEATTCGSNFPTLQVLQLNDTSSIILGSGDCTDCPNDPNAACISFNTRCAKVCAAFSFANLWRTLAQITEKRHGRCYEISVRGTTGSAQGNYSLSINCVAAIPVLCGSNVIGSTVGLTGEGRFPASGSQIHSFCPNTTELAEVSTCGSNFNTWLYIDGPGIERYANSQNGALNCGFQEVEGFGIEAGECYGIIVGGNGEEGNYSLSIDCGTRSAPIEVQCGSIVSGSTAGLFQRIQPYLLCSNQTARVEASTCGSNFPTEVSMANEMPILDRECADCSGDPNAACIGFNVRCGGREDRSGQLGGICTPFSEAINFPYSTSCFFPNSVSSAQIRFAAVGAVSVQVPGGCWEGSGTFRYGSGAGSGRFRDVAVRFRCRFRADLGGSEVPGWFREVAVRFRHWSGRLREVPDGSGRFWCRFRAGCAWVVPRGSGILRCGSGAGTGRVPEGSVGSGLVPGCAGAFEVPVQFRCGSGAGLRGSRRVPESAGVGSGLVPGCSSCFREVPVRFWCWFWKVPGCCGVVAVLFRCWFRAGSGRFRKVVVWCSGGSGLVPRGSGAVPVVVPVAVLFRCSFRAGSGKLWCGVGSGLVPGCSGAVSVLVPGRFRKVPNRPV
eukprot:s3904_g3.t1